MLSGPHLYKKKKNMLTYRCPHGPLPNGPIPATYTLMGTDPLPVDEDGRIFWHMFDFVDDIEKYHQVATFANAFSEWERWLYPWTFVSTSDPSKAVWKIRVARDNKIQYQNNRIKSPFNFDQNPDTIAVQWAYIKGYEWSLTMIISDKWMFDLVHGPNKIWFEGVIKHEIGHGLNVGHTQHKRKNEIMGDTYNPQGVITDDSVSALWDFHGDRLRDYSNKLPMSSRFLKEVASEVNGYKADNSHRNIIAIIIIVLVILFIIYNLWAFNT